MHRKLNFLLSVLFLVGDLLYLDKLAFQVKNQEMEKNVLVKM